MEADGSRWKLLSPERHVVSALEQVEVGDGAHGALLEEGRVRGVACEREERKK